MGNAIDIWDQGETLPRGNVPDTADFDNTGYLIAVYKHTETYDRLLKESRLGAFHWSPYLPEQPPHTFEASFFPFRKLVESDPALCTLTSRNHGVARAHNMTGSRSLG